MWVKMRAKAMGVESLANGTSDSHAPRASGRATHVYFLYMIDPKARRLQARWRASTSEVPGGGF